MSYFLGIDGGATRTTAWLADETGKVLRRATAGPSNPTKVGFASTQREILRAARAAVTVAATSGRRPTTPRHTMPVRNRRFRGILLDAVCAGLAGVDRVQIHRPLLAWLRKAIPARRHLLTFDAVIALHAALGRNPGIIVIAGTGSIAYGQEEGGRILRAGGWGIPFDDLGSGYDLGRKAVAAALQDYDGRGPHTSLTRRICRKLDLQNITQVVLKPLTQEQIAALAPLVIQAAHRKDKTARTLCQMAGRELARLASTLIQQFGWQRQRIQIFCAGGVFKSSAIIRTTFKDSLRSTDPRAEVRLLRREPVEGALDLAREMVNPCP